MVINRNSNMFSMVRIYHIAIDIINIQIYYSNKINACNYLHMPIIYKKSRKQNKDHVIQSDNTVIYQCACGTKRFVTCIFLIIYRF